MKRKKSSLIINSQLDFYLEKEIIDQVIKYLESNNYLNIIAYDFRHLLFFPTSTYTKYKSIFYPDSSGIFLILKIFYSNEIYRFKRLVSTDINYRIIELAVEKSHSLFFLGDTSETIESFLENIKEKHQNVKIAGYANGFEDLNNPQILNSINNSNADILMIGLGVPKQEEWLFQNSEKIKIPIRITVGAFFTFYSERKKRAPLIIQKLYLEWFYRFMKEPKRMFRRYFVLFPKVFFIVARQKWKK